MAVGRTDAPFQKRYGRFRENQTFNLVIVTDCLWVDSGLSATPNETEVQATARSVAKVRACLISRMLRSSPPSNNRAISAAT